MLKMGIAGGGPGSMIGDVHRITAEATGKAKLVCGALSSDFNKSLTKGKEIGLEENRIYSTVDEMIDEESKLPAGERMDFLIIATPNHLHVPAAIKALENGFHVMCDKPLGMSLEEAKNVEKIVERTKLKFGMSYTYRGFTAIEEIKKLISNGTIGGIRKVMIQYSQGWLSELFEQAEEKKSGLWRTDPKFSGEGGTIADIGTHAFNTVEYVTGLNIEELCAQVSILVPGRNIDDDTNILMKFSNGASGTLSVSQACTGEENALNMKIYGEKGAILWDLDQSKKIILKLAESKKIIDVNELDVDLNVVTKELVDLHSESILKGFINIYSDFIDSINTGENTSVPNIEDGVRGMLFIEKALESNKKKKWVAL